MRGARRKGRKTFSPDSISLDDDKALVVLQRVQEALLPCYALESWNSLKWLGDAWSKLVTRWKDREAEALTALADMAALRPPEDSAASWQLQVTVGAALPRLFALTAEAYRRVNERPSSMLRALRAIGAMATSYPSVFPDLIHPVAATGFSNVMAMMGGANPKGFDIDKYTQALGQVDSYEYLFQLDDDGFLPGPGDYLGPLHLRHALRSLENRYKAACPVTNSAVARPSGTASRSAAGYQDSRYGNAAETAGKIPSRKPLAERRRRGRRGSRLDATASGWHGASAGFPGLGLPSGCPATGNAGSLANPREPDDIPLQGPLSYLLQVGEAIFSFYLLLWELVLMADGGPATSTIPKPANQAAQYGRPRLRASR
jgi:hypothetical protein